MATCIEKIKCSECGSNNLQVFQEEEGGPYTGFCFNPKHYKFIPNPYGENYDLDSIPKPKIKTEDEIQEEIAEVWSYPIVDVADRKLRASTLEAFGARVSMSEKDGTTPTAIYWPVTANGKQIGWHVKSLGKNAQGKRYIWNIGNTKGGDLLNWESAKASGAYKLIITEGPEDMASVHQIFQKHGQKDDRGLLKYPVAVVSLPRGAGSSRKVIQKHSGDIAKLFKEVVLCFDDDEAGREAVKAALSSLPKAKTVKLPFKDANECVMQGATKAVYNQLSFQAEVFDNVNVVFGKDLHEAGRIQARPGELSWPFSSLNKMTRNIRKGETIYIGAGVKLGKGELRNEIAAHIVKHDKKKIFIVSPEEVNTKSYKLLAGKIASRVFHDPDREFDFEAYDKAGEIIRESVAFLNVFQNITWEKVKNEVVRMADWGAEAVFLDPITNFTDHMNAAEANTELQRIAQEASTMALDLNIVIFMFCHLKAPEGTISQDQRDNKYKNHKYLGLGNCPHELGGSVASTQFAGSRAMMRKANLMLALEGNKDPELDENIRNTRRLKILEDREFGVSGYVDLFWNKETGRFAETGHS